MKGWIIFGLVFCIYFVSIFGGFIQDDVKVIQSDPEMGKTSALISAWTRPYYYMDGNEFSVYRPVTSFSFYLNSLITGKGAWGFRLGNVLIYGLVCVLVYGVLGKMENLYRFPIRSGMTKGEKGILYRGLWRDWAFWGAVMFAVLPIHTEVVNNIVGRAEMLSLGFLLLAILKSFDKKWELTTLFLLLAMLSKETAIVGVPIIIYLILKETRPDAISKPGIASVRVTETRNDEVREKFGAGFMVILVLMGFILLRTVILGGVGSRNNATIVENPLKFMTTEKRVMNAVALIPFGVSKILFPLNLSYDYSYNQIKQVGGWMDWRVVVGMGMIVVSGIYLYRFRVKPGMTRQILDLSVVGMMLFWGPILITGNILFPIGTIFGERLWFLPSLGVVMLMMDGVRFFRSLRSVRMTNSDGVSPAMARGGGGAWIATARSTEIRNDERMLSVGVGLMLILFAVGTVIRNFDWLSQERLFLHDAQYVTQSVMAQSNAAAMYLIQHNLTAGKILMEEASLIYPKYPELLNNWGMYYLWTGKPEEARKKFEECLVERPGNGLCQRNLELVK